MAPVAHTPASLAEQQLALLPIGICVVDCDLLLLSWNKTLAQWTGIPSETAVGSNLVEFYPHLKTARFLQRMKRVFECGQPALFAPSALNPLIPIALGNGGDHGMLHKSLMVPLGDQNQFAQISLTDVTAQYQQIQVLRSEKDQHKRSQERTLAILNTATDPIITISGAGLIRSFNPAAEQLFGYSEAEVLEKNIELLLPWPYKGQHDGFLKRYQRTGKQKTVGLCREVVGQGKNGTTFPLHLSVSQDVVNDNGGDILFIGIIRDLTEQRQREEELLQASRKAQQLSAFGQILDRSLNEIYIFDTASLRFVHVNHGARENIGYTMAELREMTPLDLEPESTHASFSEMITSLLEGTEASIEFTTVQRRKDGTEYPVQVHLETSVLGATSVFAAVILDITERQEMEAQLRDSRERALSANQAKSEFLANMSHEIRTPMTAILGFNEIILDNVTDPENTAAARTVKKNGEYLVQLIDDILDLSKIECGKLDVEPRDCSPRKVVLEIAELMRVRATAKGLPLNVKFDGSIPETVRTDPTRFRQILVNIVGNAIKFTETGSVDIVTRLLNGPDEETKLQIDVTDTGIGITQDKFKTLFQPFTQADSSTIRQFGGTGLGLTISKQLVELLGGEICVSSTIGEGSMFSVTIPTGPLGNVRLTDGSEESRAETEGARVADDSETPLQNHRILLAEDGPDNQRLFSYLLKKAGAEVRLADDGQSAIDLAKAAMIEKRPFDVILMDMQMPVMDGYEATRRLRDDGYSGVIIALTAHAMVGDRQKCLDAGCNDYTTKPIEREGLIQLVAKSVSSSIPAFAVGTVK